MVFRAPARVSFRGDFEREERMMIDHVLYLYLESLFLI
jgi:hypothetical protein